MSMSLKLMGKRALVTGGACGIGRGCALELARAGADVAINDLRPGPRAEETMAEIVATGRRGAFVPGDVFERASCERVMADAVEQLGGLDILVSNPAYSRRDDFLNYDPEVFEQVIRGTLISGFHMSQLAARHFVDRQRGGKIVFISSVHAYIAYTRSVAYNAAKAGLNHLARTIAAELLPHRINVNVIEPGWIDTPGERETFGEAAMRDAAPSLPWGRLGTPEDIGRAAAFLCSPDADYITGTVLRVDGGYVLRAALPMVQV